MRSPAAALAPVTALLLALALAAPARADLDREATRRVLDSATPGLVRCASHCTQCNPAAHGRVVFQLHVEPEGDVTRVDIVEDEVGSAQLTACWSRVLGALRFPEGPRAFELMYPVVLALPE